MKDTLGSNWRLKSGVAPINSMRNADGADGHALEGLGASRGRALAGEAEIVNCLRSSFEWACVSAPKGH